MPAESLEDQPVVIAENVELGYGRTPVLSGVQLEVRQGDFWCFIGPNGEGKTTLIKALLGAVKPRRGQIVLRSDFIKRTRIGFVPQESELNPAVSTTVQEFILGGMIGVPLDAATRKIRLEQSMKLMEIIRFRERRIWELSGGQRQRALIARALVRDPLMMIVDEPTAGLDFAAAAGLLETITQLNRQKGITVVFVTHDLDIGVRNSSHVALFRGGKVLAGRTSEVFNSANLSTTFGAPMEVNWRADGKGSVHSLEAPSEKTESLRETFLEESIEGVKQEENQVRVHSSSPFGSSSESNAESKSKDLTSGSGVTSTKTLGDTTIDADRQSGLDHKNIKEEKPALTKVESLDALLVANLPEVEIDEGFEEDYSDSDHSGASSEAGTEEPLPVIKPAPSSRPKKHGSRSGSSKSAQSSSVSKVGSVAKKARKTSSATKSKVASTKKTSVVEVEAEAESKPGEARTKTATKPKAKTKTSTRKAAAKTTTTTAAKAKTPKSRARNSSAKSSKAKTAKAKDKKE